jgi:hypothetical protein
MPSPAATAYADQLSAAVREAQTVMRDLSQAMNEPMVTTRPTGWLLAQGLAVQAAMNTGTARACRHVADSPTVAYAAVWKPGFITCLACRPLLAPSPLEDLICDKCQTHTPGGLHPCTVAVGPIILAFGLCPGCLADLDRTTNG